MLLIALEILKLVGLTGGNVNWLGVVTDRMVRCMPSILLTLYDEYLMKETLAEFGDFKITGNISNKVKFEDDTDSTAVRYGEQIS